jgi:hypothetical protein
MYYLLKKEAIKDIIIKSAQKTGSIKLLSSELNIAKSMLYRYLNRKTAINEKRLNQILDYAKIKMNNKMICQTFPDNWKQTKGGKNCVKSKKKKGTYQKQLELCHKKSSEYMKKLHKEMKKTKPKEYYISQYEKFKKIGGYKYLTENNEKVRNKLEKDVADILKNSKIQYQYEPYININNKAFFPDFVINKNIIIECTAWKGYDKAIKLKKKIKILKNKYMIYVIIPKDLYNYYKILDKHLVLGLDEFVPLAQTFPRR